MEFSDLVIVELFLNIFNEVLLLFLFVFNSIFDQLGKLNVFGGVLRGIKALELSSFLLSERLEVDALLFGMT